jgi:hypothetical protein
MYEWKSFFFFLVAKRTRLYCSTVDSTVLMYSWNPPMMMMTLCILWYCTQLLYVCIDRYRCTSHIPPLLSF